MATRRIKFLHREKILQSDIEIRLEVLGLAKRFSAKLNLASYKFPADSRILVDAKQLMERIRFDFGTVGSPKSSNSLDISRLRGERVTFDVLVVEPKNFRKLGSAETVRPIKDGESPNGPRELLPIDASGQLDGVVWKVGYTDSWEDASDAPVLLFDKVAAQGSAATFVGNSWVRGLVLPAVMREILTRVLVTDEHNYEPTSTAWRDAWLRFGSRFAGQDPPEVGDDGPLPDVDVDWIEMAVGKFSTHAQFLPNLIREIDR